MKIFFVGCWLFLFNLLMMSTKAFSQEGKDFSINYSITYDNHDLFYKYYRPYVKFGLCSSNYLGIGYTKFISRNKKIGIGIQPFIGNKSFIIISNYNKLILQKGYEKYSTIEDYKFRFNYLVFGVSAKFFLKINNKLESWLGYEYRFNKLLNQNFTSDSIFVYEKWSRPYSVKQTYLVKDKFDINSFSVGLNCRIKKRLLIGLFISGNSYSARIFQGGTSEEMFERSISTGLIFGFKI